MNKPEENEKELIMSDEHLAVYQIITNSKSKYVTRAMILSQLGKDFTYGRKLSAIINDLTTKYRKPIGASSSKDTKGYFIIENETDKYLAKRDLYSRTMSMLERYEAVDSIEIKGDNNDVQNG